MSTTVQPEAPTQSTPIVQSISAFLHAEVMVDLDNGRPTFVTATESNLGDLRETSPARFRGMIAAARADLERMERLALEFEARDTLRAIVAEHELTLVEVDMREVAAFGPDLARRLRCWAAKENGRMTVWVPESQDPIARVHAVAELVNDLQAQAAVQA